VREICRLDWSEIDLDGSDEEYPYGCIEVPAEKAKSRRRRPVKIEQCLAAWLRPFAKRSGRVANMNDKYFCQLRAEAAAKAGIKWPKNALRHGFASNHIARHKDAQSLSYEMGHRGTDLIFSNYRKVVRPQKAKEYCSLTPFSRAEVAHVLAFTAEAYPWHVTVGRVVVAREWIDGVRSLAHFFGVQRTVPYKWFNDPGCPPRPENDRFHIPTWNDFVQRNYRRRKPAGADAQLLFFASGASRCGRREVRKYFETEQAAIEFAERINRARLAKELNLQEIPNVIEFPSAGSVRLPTQPLPIGNVSIAG
jgi:hypothetical protein